MFSSGLEYQVGGNLNIYPRNSKKSVERFKKIINLNHNYVFTITNNTRDQKLPVPSQIGLDTFLSSYLDLSAEIK